MHTWQPQPSVGRTFVAYSRKFDTLLSRPAVDCVFHGEVDNQVKGIVRGKIWMEGRPKPITLELQGNAGARNYLPSARVF